MIPMYCPSSVFLKFLSLVTDLFGFFTCFFFSTIGNPMEMFYFSELAISLSPPPVFVYLVTWFLRSYAWDVCMAQLAFIVLTSSQFAFAAQGWSPGEMRDIWWSSSEFSPLRTSRFDSFFCKSFYSEWCEIPSLCSVSSMGIRPASVLCASWWAV